MAAVRAAFRLKCRLQLDERRSEAAEHVFDNVIRSNTKNLTPHFGQDMSIAEMPREPHELTRVLVGDIDHGLRRGPNDEPAPILDLQAISIAHCGRCVQMQEHLVPLVRDQAETTTVPIVEVEGERADRKLLRPFAGTSMDDGSLRPVTVRRCLRRHISTGNSVVPSEALMPARK
jgi:hypothetical protein